MHTPDFDKRKRGDCVEWGIPHTSETAYGQKIEKKVEKRKTAIEDLSQSFFVVVRIFGYVCNSPHVRLDGLSGKAGEIFQALFDFFVRRLIIGHFPVVEFFITHHIKIARAGKSK